MEELYRKKKNGRYEKVVGYSNTLQDGIWLVQTKPSSTRISSLMWKVGDLKRVADVTTHAAHLMCNAAMLAEFHYTHPEFDDRVKYEKDEQ